MIEAHNLIKRYGTVTAVNDLSFTLIPGQITGFLGPNGAGKTTTMRMIVGLDAPNSGEVTIGGRLYRQLPTPLTEVGVLLDAKAMQGNRRAKAHLEWMAASNGLPLSRVDECLRIVGLESVAKGRLGKFSLGMSQRLGIAAALLGDPGVLIFDEPVNGLDPEGIVWVRQLMQALAREGRTIFVSSHLMSEMALTAQRLVVIGRGKLIADTSVEEFIERSTTQSVLVRTPDGTRLANALVGIGATVTPTPDGALDVTGVDAPAVGEMAAKTGVVLHELSPQRASLEEAFMELTKDSVEYHTGDTGITPAVPAGVAGGEPR
ncbi:MAG: ATP-binding cassette domain-containing protein [Acidimicrobiaceae bacterium]|nr:ATP-binding cassette domain-containing protein [Acidimicrobiaceae bacterium]